MKTLVPRYLVWLTVIVGVSLALHGATRWIVAVLLLGVCFGSFVVDCGAARDRARPQVPERETPSAPSPIALEESTSPPDDEPPESEPPPWSLCLLVDADEVAGTVRPTIQVGGPRVPELAIVHLDVIDGLGDVRLTTERRFWYPDLGADLTLGTLAVSAGASVDEVARWDWRLTLCDGGGELARQRGPLTGAGLLNEEAELDVLDLPSSEPPATVMDLETTLALLAQRLASS